MKEFENALSNKVWLDDDGKVIKKYSKDMFKSAFGCQETEVLEKIGYKFTFENNILEMEFIENVPFDDNNITNEMLEMVANALKDLHALDTTGIKTSNFEEVYEDFLSEDDEILKDYPIDGVEYQIAMEAFDILESGPQVILHNDVVEGNLLIVGDKIKLIDFEYSGLGNPIFDIASFITERELNEEQIAYFVSQFDNVNLDDLKTVSKFLQIFWTRWALYKYSISDKEIYKIIADWKFEQYLKLNK